MTREALERIKSCLSDTDCKGCAGLNCSDCIAYERKLFPLAVVRMLVNELEECQK